MSTNTINRFRFTFGDALFAISLLALSACGGGGGGTVPPAPILSLSYQSAKNFQFSWVDVSGETEYRLLENPDGGSGFSQVALSAMDAQSQDLIVSLPARMNARYILQACNVAGCADSNEVTIDVAQLVQAIGYLKASNTETADQFGISVALSGDGSILAVGANAEDSNATGINGEENNGLAVNSGAVYVFTRSGALWNQQAYIKASNTGNGDGFGLTVALSDNGNTLAVGSTGDDSNAMGIDGNEGDSAAGTNSGAVYVFIRSGVDWNQQAYIKASNTQALDRFGVSLSLSGDGNTLAVGADNEASNATGIDGDQNDNTEIGSGAVYLFSRSAVGWGQQAYIKASTTQTLDRFGGSVTLSADGNNLAVGAMGEDSNATIIDGNQNNNAADSSGAVYLFIRSADIWSQQAYIKASNTGADDLFGGSLALAANGNTLAVGARGEFSNATGINGDQSNNSADATGAVYVFIRNGILWSQQAYIKASNSAVNDQFGRVSLSDDGNILAVGAAGEDSSATDFDGDQSDNTALASGAVYLFTRSNANWSQQAYIKAPNTGNLDLFGQSVALTADGTTLATSALLEDSDDIGFDGDQSNNSASNSGAVYLY